MSIEKLLGDMIDALKENTAAINAAVHAKSEVTLAAAKLADKAKSTKSAKDEDEEKAPAPRTRASRASKEDDEEKPAKKAAAKDEDEDDRPAEFTLKDIKEAYGKFLDVDDDDEAAARTAKVKKIVQHLGLAKISDAKPRDFEDLMGWLDDLKRGKRPDLQGGADSGKDLV